GCGGVATNRSLQELARLAPPALRAGVSGVAGPTTRSNLMNPVTVAHAFEAARHFAELNRNLRPEDPARMGPVLDVIYHHIKAAFKGGAPPAPPLPQNGPLPPCGFCWGDKTVMELTADQYRLLTLLWDEEGQQPRPPVAVESLIAHLCGRAGD